VPLGIAEAALLDAHGNDAIEVFSFAVAQPSAWHKRSMRAWS
jgi:hypothetical protein